MTLKGKNSAQNVKIDLLVYQILQKCIFNLVKYKYLILYQDLVT